MKPELFSFLCLFHLLPIVHVFPAIVCWPFLRHVVLHQSIYASFLLFGVVRFFVLVEHKHVVAIALFSLLDLAMIYCRDDKYFDSCDDRLFTFYKVGRHKRYRFVIMMDAYTS